MFVCLFVKLLCVLFACVVGVDVLFALFVVCVRLIVCLFVCCFVCLVCVCDGLCVNLCLCVLV